MKSLRSCLLSVVSFYELDARLFYPEITVNKLCDLVCSTGRSGHKSFLQQVWRTLINDKLLSIGALHLWVFVSEGNDE